MIESRMVKTTNSKLTIILLAILMGAVLSLGILFLGAKHIYATSSARGEFSAPFAERFLLRSLSLVFSSPRTSAQVEDACYVPSDQTVVEWKSTYWARCRISIDGFCIWPIPHKHMTYKVTVNSGTPLRDRSGEVIPAISGQERSDWLTYDSTGWNALQYDPRRKNRYLDYEPIASNEYVVMVETRFRLLNNVDSSLGICMQQP